MNNLQPHQIRVIEEKADLDLRTSRLFDFLQGDVFRTLDTAEQGRLRRQWTAMLHYSEILRERIGAFPFNQGA